MTEAERYQAVQENIKTFLDKAADDHSAGGMVGLGSVWLAAELFARNEQVHQKKLEVHGENATL
jgi:hypothetical protein